MRKKYLIILIFMVFLFYNYKLYNMQVKVENFTNKKNTNLVFSSVGDNSNFEELWCDDNRNYDVYVIYYGDNEDIYNKYKSKVDFIEKRKGSKFQNFHYLYNNNPELINQYERFFILDDDIIFNTNSINEMFALSKQYDLWICGPTFKADGNSKISWGLTIHQKNHLLRYTNFVEVNTPLFNKFALDKLMKIYDPELIGFGIDFLYTHAIALDVDESIYKKKIALIDKITCINPLDDKKNNSRELYKIKNAHDRAKIWLEFKKKNNIPNFNMKMYGGLIEYYLQ